MHKSVKYLITIALATALTAGGMSSAFAADTSSVPSEMEKTHSALAQQAAVEGMVLLDNAGKGLPIAKSGNIALYGVGSYQSVKGGTGSGDTNNRETIRVRAGFEAAGYNVTTNATYWSDMTTKFDALNPSCAPGYTGGGMFFGAGCNYAGAEIALTTDTVKPTAATDVAFYVLARNSGEGQDRTATKGDYYLTDVEYDNIAFLGASYAKVVVLLNVGAVVDTSFFKAINAFEKDPGGGLALDSLLLMSQLGGQTGPAVVELVNGTTSPSGKTTDTWASSYGYYPAAETFATNDGVSATENYTEGLYVGYRYFDSFYKKLNPSNPDAVVNYPFGYGLSYTDFYFTGGQVSYSGGNVTVSTKVSNVGATYSGKEVVEVYYSAPQAGLHKPYQELAGYAKTETLAPGQGQTVTITFPVSQLASYDPVAAAYKLQRGKYTIRVGNSSRNTHVAGVLEVGPTTVITEQLSNQESSVTFAKELTADPANFYSYNGEAAEIAAAPVVAVPSASITAQDNHSVYEQSVTVAASDSLYPFSGSRAGTTTALVNAANASNWNGSGAAYAPKTGESVKSVTVPAAVNLYDVYRGTATMDQLIASLSVQQLAAIVDGTSSRSNTFMSANGAAGYTTPAYESLGIAGMTLSDGPAGLRITQTWNDGPGGTGGTDWYQFATAWPIGTALAQTWNTPLIEQVGKAIGAEMVHFGVTMWLAPGMNLHRDPLNGRNFEYYSEDPLVSGLIAAATTKGLQSNNGVGVTLKHYAANSQETDRNGGTSNISERPLRELYLKGFEIAVKSTQPMAIMSSYNQINGRCVAQSYDILTDITRGEWGFDGLVMTDWSGCNNSNPTGYMYAGNDLIEPGGSAANLVMALVRTSPTVDAFGLPAITTSPGFSFGTYVIPTSYSIANGNLVLSATGTETITTTVDSSVIGATLQTGTSGGMFGGGTITPKTPFTSVQEAYEYVQGLLAASAPELTAAQKAAVTISDVQGTAPNITSFKVSFKGSYSMPLRLGDLQACAARVLKVNMKSMPFKQLADANNVSGITVGSYTGSYSNLTSYVTGTRSAVGAGDPLPVTTTPPVQDANKTDLAKVKITAANAVWTGKQITSVKLSVGSTVLKSGTDYTITAKGANTVTGKGSLTITGKGAYTGTAAVAFKILPKATSAAVSVGKKQVTVKWTKAASAAKVTGYIVSYRVKGTSAWKTKTVAKAGTAKLTIKSLKKGKAYQVRVAVYKSVSGTKYTSAYSAVKTSKKVK